jgi:hypothetical protein
MDGGQRKAIRRQRKQQEEGGGCHSKKRGTKDTIKGNWAIRVVGGGDAAWGKCNNQIEATMAVVGTVGAAIDGEEARAKGEMSGWRTMQGDGAAEDATGWGVRQRKAIGQRRMQQEGRADDGS